MSETLALQRLIQVAERDTGQSEIIRCFLLSLYNGDAYSLVPYRFRNLDRDLFVDVLEVLRKDITVHQTEIHKVIPGTAHLWLEWREWYNKGQKSSHM